MLGPCTNLKTGLIYRPLNNPYVSRLMKRRTYSADADIYEKGRQAAIGMVSTLRKGGFMLFWLTSNYARAKQCRFLAIPPRPLWPISNSPRKQASLFLWRRPSVGRAAASKSLFLHRFICSKQLMTKTAERSQNRSISRLKHG